MYVTLRVGHAVHKRQNVLVPTTWRELAISLRRFHWKKAKIVLYFLQVPYWNLKKNAIYIDRKEGCLYACDKPELGWSQSSKYTIENND